MSNHHNGKSRDDLAREANQVRTKLLRTVEQLDQRRHDALDVRRQVREHIRLLTVASGALMLLTVGAAVLVVQRMATAAERRRRYRWRLAKQVWHHPDRAMRAERRSFFGEVARSVLLTVVTAVLAYPARRAMHVLLAGVGAPALPPEGGVKMGKVAKVH